MARDAATGEDLDTAQTAHRSGDPTLMTTPFTQPLLVVPVRLSQHEIVVARLAAAHGHGDHTSPIVACYQCLHGVARSPVTLRKAA